MDKEEKYSNRMRLPKDGAILAENDNIILKAVSEDQKYYIHTLNCWSFTFRYTHRSNALSLRRNDGTIK